MHAMMSSQILSYLRLLGVCSPQHVQLLLIKFMLITVCCLRLVHEYVSIVWYYGFIYTVYMQDRMQQHECRGML